MTESESKYKDYLRNYYDQKAEDYSSTYSGKGRYRSNYFRLQTVLALLDGITPRPHCLLEAGCGDARVLVETLKRGYHCIGFDYSDRMLETGRNLLIEAGFPSDLIRQGDIYDMQEPDQSFDVALCLGVLENLPRHDAIFGDFHRILRPNGRVIASFGNTLFSLFTFNKHTVSFIDSLLTDIRLPSTAKEEVLDKLCEWFRLEDIRHVKKVIEDSEIERAGIHIPTYNPLNVRDAMREFGFDVEAIRFYHYHPIPPRFETQHPELFGRFAEALETIEYDWRGAILCSAMIVQVRKID